MKFLTLFLLPLSAFAGNELGNGRTIGGNELGNGGDYVAQQFIAGGRELVARLRKFPDSRIPNVDALEKAVERVKVTSAGDLTLHGAEVDAINFPADDHIDVNRARWQEAPSEKRASLVLHEYLGILQVNDLHYEISGSYADAFRVPEERPRKFSLEAGTAISSGVVDNFRWYKRPGVELTLGYDLSQRDTVTLELMRQSHSEEDPQYSESSSLTTIAAGYKRWLNDSRVLRPFLTVSGGYTQPHHESTWASGLNRYGETTYEKYDGSYLNTGALLLGAGGGARYAFAKDWGITGSGQLQSIGLGRRGGQALALQFNLGVDVLL